MVKPREEFLGAITLLDEDSGGLVDANSATVEKVGELHFGTGAGVPASGTVRFGSSFSVLSLNFSASDTKILNWTGSTLTLGGDDGLVSNLDIRSPQVTIRANTSFNRLVIDDSFVEFKTDTDGGGIAIDAGPGTGANDGGYAELIAGNASGTGEGGRATLYAGSASEGPGGNVDLAAGSTASSGSSDSGSILLTSGNHSGTGTGFAGQILLAAGSATGNGKAGHIIVSAGTATANDGGYIKVTSGNGTDSADLAGALYLRAGHHGITLIEDTDTGGESVSGGSGSGDAGHTYVSAGSSWDGDAGNLYLAGGKSYGVGADGYVHIDGDLEIDGKLTVTGLIDPTGLVLTEQASAPSIATLGEGTVWVKDDSTLQFTDSGGIDYTIAGGTSDSLSATLAIGNTTGVDASTTGNPIIISDGDNLQFGSSVATAGDVRTGDLWTLYATSSFGETSGDFTVVDFDGSPGVPRLRVGGFGTLVAGNSPAVILGTANAIAGAASGPISLETGTSSGSGNTGAISLSTGDTTGISVGNISLHAGDNTSTGSGGSIGITAGESTSGNPGDVTLTAGGTAGSNTGGVITLTAGLSVSGSGGGITVSGGDASGAGAGGSLTLRGGTTSTGNAGDVILSPGISEGGTDGFVHITRSSQTIPLLKLTAAATTVQQFLNSVDPVGNITGSPGDLAFRVNGTLSSLYQHIGSSSNNTDWAQLLYDGADISINDLTANDGYFFGDVTVDGKLTVNGIIDPTGLILNEQTAAPTTPAAGEALIWVDDVNSRFQLTNGINLNDNLVQNVSQMHFSDAGNGLPSSGDLRVSDAWTWYARGTQGEGFIDMQLGSWSGTASPATLTFGSSTVNTTQLTNSSGGIVGVSASTGPFITTANGVSSSNIIVDTGDASAINSGDVNISTGDATGGGASSDSGDINLTTGTATSAGSSGNIILTAGTTSDASAGSITLNGGDSTGAGNAGGISLIAGTASGAGNDGIISFAGDTDFSSDNLTNVGSIQYPSLSAGIPSTGEFRVTNAWVWTGRSSTDGEAYVDTTIVDWAGFPAILTIGSSTVTDLILDAQQISITGGDLDLNQNNLNNVQDGYFFGDVTVDGKLTVNGIIDPTGLILNEQSSAPTTPAAGEALIWVDDVNSRWQLSNGINLADNLIQNVSQMHFSDAGNGLPSSGDLRVSDAWTWYARGTQGEGFIDMQLGSWSGTASPATLTFGSSTVNTTQLTNSSGGIVGVSASTGPFITTANGVSSSNIIVDTGDASAINSGDVNISTGDATGGGASSDSGDINLTTGTATSAGSSGDIVLTAGTTSDASAGGIILNGGDSTGTGGAGGISLIVGTASGAGNDGTVSIIGDTAFNNNNLLSIGNIQYTSAVATPSTGELRTSNTWTWVGRSSTDGEAYVDTTVIDWAGFPAVLSIGDSLITDLVLDAQQISVTGGSLDLNQNNLDNVQDGYFFGDVTVVGAVLNDNVITDTPSTTQDNYSPTNWDTATVVRLDTTGVTSISGFDATATANRKTIFNVSSNNITLQNENAGSSASNRFSLNADVTILPNEGVDVKYDSVSQRWRVIR